MTGRPKPLLTPSPLESKGLRHLPRSDVETSNRLQAIQKSPNYALAYAALADCQVLFGFFGLMPHKEVIPRTKEAVMKAPAMDDAISEAHASLHRSCLAKLARHEQAIAALGHALTSPSSRPNMPG